MCELGFTVLIFQKLNAFEGGGFQEGKVLLVLSTKIALCLNLRFLDDKEMSCGSQDSLLLSNFTKRNSV